MSFLPSLSFNRNYGFVLPSFTFSPNQFESDLLTSIDCDDAQTIRNLVKSSLGDLSKPLSNGDLPLGIAVKNGKEGAMRALLESGADPLVRDSQQLNALDYALLKSDHYTFLELLKEVIHEDFEQIGKLLNDETSSKQLNATLTEIKNEIKKEIEAPKKSSRSNSILHRAIAKGSKNNVEDLLKNPETLKIIDQPNDQGQTPLHYAASLGRLDLMQLLHQHGANMRAIDKHQQTPLALLVTYMTASAKQHDPLKITYMDALCFTAVAATWALKFCTPENTNFETFKVISEISFGMVFAGKFLSMFRDAQSFKDGMAFGSYMFGEMVLRQVIPGASCVLNGIRTARLAMTAFEGLQNCWKNSSLGAGRAMLKAVVGYGPTLHMVWSTARQIKLNLFEPENDHITKLEEINSKINQCKRSFSGLFWQYGKECEQRGQELMQHCLDDGPLCEDVQQKMKTFMSHVNELKEKNDFSCPHNALSCQDKADVVFRHCLDLKDSQACEDGLQELASMRERLNGIQKWAAEQDSFCVNSRVYRICSDHIRDISNFCRRDIDNSECVDAKSNFEELKTIKQQSACESYPDSLNTCLGSEKLFKTCFEDSKKQCDQAKAFYQTEVIPIQFKVQEFAKNAKLGISDDPGFVCSHWDNERSIRADCVVFTDGCRLSDDLNHCVEVMNTYKKSICDDKRMVYVSLPSTTSTKDNEIANSYEKQNRQFNAMQSDFATAVCK